MHQVALSPTASDARKTPAVSTNEAVIHASDLYRSGGKVLRRVAVNKERLIVERDGYPVAIIVPYEQPQPSSENPLRDLVIKLGQEAQRQGLTEEQLLAELEESKRRVFEERYGCTETDQKKTRRKRT